ncbi:response regulator [Kaistia sp. UC242_56]|uniref:FixJ family two-component response regulator n=1 Tax=Kaistia defluvii TaxID=410841 RepID=A0ABV2R6B3_9HYPH
MESAICVESAPRRAYDREGRVSGIHGKSVGKLEFVSTIPPNSPPLIAVVDDDDDVRTALDDMLKSLGYAAQLFETADAFLSSGSGGEVDCVISDVQMPGTSGLQLARVMQLAKMPVILITAFPTPEVEQQAEAAGVRRLLVKPFDSSDLIAELDRLLA